MTQTLPTEKMTVEQMRGIAQKHGYKTAKSTEKTIWVPSIVVKTLEPISCTM